MTIQAGIEYYCSATDELVTTLRPDGDGTWLVQTAEMHKYVVHESTLELPEWDGKTVMEREG